MPGPIVVGYDGSDSARDALALARALGDLLGAPLELLCAYDFQRLSSRVPERGETLRAEALLALEGARGALGDEVAMTARPAGSPARALHDLAVEAGATAVVVGSSRSTDPGRVHAGSVALRLLSGAPCPVAVAPRGLAERGAPDWPLRVGVAFDGELESQSALEAGRRLAMAAHGAMTLIEVFDPTPPVYDPQLALVAMPEYTAERRKRSSEELDARVAGLGDGLAVHGELIDGDPVEGLVTSSLAFDLLVLGSRGYGPLRSVLLGGVSRRVVAAAHCAVLVVPRGADWAGSSEPAAAASR